MAAITEYRAHGNAILERLSGVDIPSALKPRVAAFKTTHGAFEAAAREAEAKRALRDNALEAVGAADDKLDTSIETLAEKATGAQIGKRLAPLAAFTKHTVHQLTSLAYKKEADEVLALAGKIAKAKPPKDVTKAAAACAKDAKGVQTALKGLVKPQAAYAKALAARDALLPDWTKALRTLKKIAAAVWVEDEATYKAIFAQLDAVQAPKAKRTKKPPGPAGGSLDT